MTDTDTEPNVDETEDQEHEDHEPGNRETEPEPEVSDEVQALRQEAGSRRVQAREATERADALHARLVAQTITSATTGILADPDDLILHIDEVPTDDDNFPDADAIRALAEELVKDKPHLAARRFGQVDAGPQGEAPPGPTSIMGAIRGLT